MAKVFLLVLLRVPYCITTSTRSYTKLCSNNSTHKKFLLCRVIHPFSLIPYVVVTPFLHYDVGKTRTEAVLRVDDGTPS